MRLTAETGPYLDARTSAIVTARAYAADGSELLLGDADVDFELAGVGHRGSACDHMLGTCLRGSQVRVLTDGPGTLRITARFGGLTAPSVVPVR